MSQKKVMLFVTLLVFILMVSLCAGCGKAADEDATATADGSNIVTVEFSYPPYGYDTAKEDAFWTKYIDEFEKENPNIKINMTVESWDNVYTKWDEYWSTGDTPDIGYCDGTDAVEYGMEGKALPLTDIVNALGGPDKFSEDCLAFQQDGEYYSVSQLYRLPCFGIPYRFIGGGRLYRTAQRPGMS